MKRIAYSNVIRIIAFLLMQILVMTSLVLAFYFGNTITTTGYLEEALKGKSYLESQYFREQLITNINNANYFIECQQDFEVAGEYNENKEVTISQFLSNDKDVSIYSSSFSYKLQDLVEWSQESIETITLYELLNDNNFTENAKKIVQNPELIMDAWPKENSATATSQDEVNISIEEESIAIEQIKSLGINITSEALSIPIIKESYETTSGDSILSYYFSENDFSEIEKTSNEMQEALSTIAEEYGFYKKYETYFKGLDSSNFKIFIQDYKGDVILNNCIDESTDYLSYFDGDQIKGGIIYNATNKEFTFTDYINDDVYLDMFKVPNQVNYVYAVGIDANFPHKDEFLNGYQSFNNSRNSMIAMISSVFVILLCFIYLVAVSGRSAKDKVIHLNGFDRIKTEIGAGIMIALGIIVLVAINSNFYPYGGRISLIVGLGIETGLFTLGFLSLVKRIKAGQLWKNSLIYSMLHWMVVFVKNRKVTTKIVVMYLAFSVITLGLLGIAVNSGSFLILVVWFSFSGAVGFFLLREAVARQSIINGIKKISEGDLEYKIDTANLTGSNEVLANAINNIGEGLHNAVDAGVKNERLKTDLITNVSHDIKTPLTSIINYVDLLKRENIEDAKIKGYIDILENKSQRLKNLTEDLVEASKISSGNIKLEMSKINFAELINQTEGEFSEKLEAKGLQIIKTLPLDSVFIEADGRRMWRVIENLYNNVAKYAMPNTRVYVDVKSEADKVICSIKNISENPLNIDADELTERFIRGDVSRSTEGSGLGLSIAKNLTSLQKGTFEIYLDGDLFKVTITFPRVE